MDNTIHDDLLPYKSLSPVANADTDGNYSKMLRWALENRDKEDIKNIALTGPYGSGKSSILKTFQAQNKNEDLEFLNISLATFKEELEDNQAPATAEAKQTLLRLIELSILQQIFYHEKDEDIPDTRFKKTRSFPEENAVNLSWNIFFFIISAVYLFYSTEIWNAFNVTLRTDTAGILNMFALFTVLWMGYQFIRQSIRPLRSIQLKKLNFQQAEFAVDEKISKSILNEHLDEILYFFEVTKYTVVVFEDLDRFQQTEIFTKLRELNHLINYSKKMNGRKVAFLYAVRDEMFQDKDRTKFFDFIIPIIPVINSSNSNEMLIDAVKKNSYQIETDLIDNISYFVDDMRLLYNIMNEYHLYHKKLNVKDQNKLLAMIVYKNIYPTDFVALSNSSGDLYKVLTNKKEYVKNLVDEADGEIKKLKVYIKAAEAVTFRNEQELRKLYILEYLARHPTAVAFHNEKIDYPIMSAVDESIFQFFIDDTMKFVSRPNSYDAHRPFQTKFSEIEKAVDANHTYEQRLAHIADSAKDNIDYLKNQLSEVEFKKINLKNKSIKELMETDLIKLSIENEKQQQLISILLLGGYIDENYLDYVSIFYEGSITKMDREFLLNVKAHIRSDFSYKLGKVEKLITKIPALDFDKDYVLNFDLVEYLLASGRQANIRKKIFSVLSNESENSFNFVDQFLDVTQHKHTFFKYLIGSWPNLWKFVSKSSLVDKRKELYLRNILECEANVSELKKIAKNSTFKADLESKSNLLEIIPANESSEELIKALKLKLNNIDFNIGNPQLINFIIDGNFYDINLVMLKQVLAYKNALNERTFEISNYTSILFKAPLSITSYINENINTYLQNVWLKLPENKFEEVEVLEKLLNHDDIPYAVKSDIIGQTLTKIVSLEKIKYLSVCQELMIFDKVVCKWDNLLQYLQDNNWEFDEVIAQFVSVQGNAQYLSINRLNNTDHPKGKDVVQKLAKTIISQNGIENKAYETLLPGIPYFYNNLNFVDNLDEEKIESLIKNDKFGMTPDNFNYILANFPNLIVKFVETRPEFVTANLDKFSLGSEHLIGILNSVKFNIEQKDKILSTINDNIIIRNAAILQEIGYTIVSEGNLTLSTEVQKQVLMCPILSIDYKIRAYIKWSDEFVGSTFFEIVRTWTNGFEDIQPNGKQAVIKDTEINWKFVDIIKQNGYIYSSKPDKKGIRIYNKKKK